MQLYWLLSFGPIYSFIKSFQLLWVSLYGHYLVSSRLVLVSFFSWLLRFLVLVQFTLPVNWCGWNGINVSCSYPILYRFCKSASQLTVDWSCCNKKNKVTVDWHMQKYMYNVFDLIFTVNKSYNWKNGKKLITLKHDESIYVSGTDMGALMLLLIAISVELIPMSSPQYETIWSNEFNW